MECVGTQLLNVSFSKNEKQSSLCFNLRQRSGEAEAKKWTITQKMADPRQSGFYGVFTVILFCPKFCIW